MNLKNTKDVRLQLTKRYHAHYQNWLQGLGEWPLEIPLGQPSEKEVQNHLLLVQQWVKDWQHWDEEGALLWIERHWSILGKQRLPHKLRLEHPLAVASLIGEKKHWIQAEKRFQQISTSWPILSSHLARYFDTLMMYPEEDFQRLITMLDWLYHHPNSNLYPRQLPIEGLDTKWLSKRKKLITDLLSLLRQNELASSSDFYQCCGLKSPPHCIRMRILDQQIQKQVGGLSDITAPVEEIAQLSLPIRHVIIVENLETGLALPNIPHTVAFMGLGYGVDVLAHIPWLDKVHCLYWGDIDTHGFAILHQARNHLPHIQSILMDTNTLLRHKSLWGTEPKPHASLYFHNLSQEEQQLYTQLKQHHWGANIRLEQERIDWTYAESVFYLSKLP